MRPKIDWDCACEPTIDRGGVDFYRGSPPRPRAAVRVPLLIVRKQTHLNFHIYSLLSLASLPTLIVAVFSWDTSGQRQLAHHPLRTRQLRTVSSRSTCALPLPSSHGSKSSSPRRRRAASTTIHVTVAAGWRGANSAPAHMPSHYVPISPRSSLAPALCFEPRHLAP